LSEPEREARPLNEEAEAIIEREVAHADSQ